MILCVNIIPIWQNSGGANPWVWVIEFEKINKEQLVNKKEGCFDECIY
jgi:hypothetical protein